MSKRFICPNWKELRAISPDLQRAFFYCWDKADAIGVYEYDPDYMSVDLGFKVSFEDLLKIPNVKKIGAAKFIFLDFIEVNYTALKPGYNPHKPAFRDLERHKLTLNSSLNQACIKLEEEEEDKEEDKDRLEGVVGGEKNEQPPGPAKNDLSPTGYFPKAEDVGDLPSAKIEAVKMKLRARNGVSITNEDVGDLWGAFKIQNLTGEKSYRNLNDVHNHFLNTCNTIKINEKNRRNFNGAQRPQESSYAGGF